MIAVNRKARFTTARADESASFPAHIMIENLRKYPGVIIAALVAVFIGFLLMDSQRFFRQSGANSVKVGDVTYDINEFQRLGPSSRKLSFQLNMRDFSMALVDPNSTSEDSAEKSFFANRILLQQAGRSFGIEPGEEEIATYLRERSPFADSDPTDPTKKKFNKENYDSFIKNSLGKSGLSEKDLFNLVKDYLIYEKVAKTVAGSLEVNRDELRKTYQSFRQRITASYATINLSDYASKENPSEEDVKKFWEERKDSFVTENRRKFSYVIASPVYPDDAKEAPKPPVAQNGQPAPEPSEADKQITEKRRRAELKVAADMDDLLTKIDNSSGGEFENAVNAAGWKLLSTDLFTPTTLPNELQSLIPRKTSKTLSELLFGLKTTFDPLSKFTVSFPVGEADWLIARLDAEEEVRVKTYEEAKEEARKQLIDKNAREALKKAADEMQAKIKEAVKGGKSFADAAKEQNLSVLTVGPMGNGEAPAGHLHAKEIFTAAQYANPGELTDNVSIETGTLLVICDKREIYKDENFESMIDNGVEYTKTSLRIQAFQAWLSEQSASAKSSS